MLVLPIKGVWYKMILADVKKEEYRARSRYYIKRFETACGKDIETAIREQTSFDILLRNGYAKNCPTIRAQVHLRLGYGRPEWGAEEGVSYFILCIEKYEEVTK